MSVTIEAQPDSLRQSAIDFLSSRGRLSPAAQAAALRDGFPCLKSVTVRRDWLKRTARLELALRTGIAAAVVKGRPAGYLSEDGVVFAAPAGLYAVVAPVVDAAGAGPEDLKTAAKIVRAAAQPGALPAALESVAFVSAQDGWEARLVDGTAVLWGDGRWTGDKFSRLREVLADARTQSGAPAHFVADLRYFEDGRVLLRPVIARTFR
jgi:cell division septal protein FtsQ